MRFPASSKGNVALTRATATTETCAVGAGGLYGDSPPAGGESSK